MSTLKIITYINWLLISAYGAFVVYYLLQPTSPTDAAGQGLESAVKGASVVLLLIMAALNLPAYLWTKIVALIVEVLTLLLLRYIFTH